MSFIDQGKMRIAGLCLLLFTGMVSFQEKKPAHHLARQQQKSFWTSLPRPGNYVNDYEDLFTQKEEQELNRLLAQYDKQKGTQVVLITVDTFMTSKDSFDLLIHHIANAWAVGHKDNNKGITIGISRSYRKIRIANGYGISRILSDEETKNIIDTVFIPGFKKGKYYEATGKGIEVLLQQLDQPAR